MTRDTSTGSDFEEIVERAVLRSGRTYNFHAKSQVNVGPKPGGGSHRIDWELIDSLDENIRGLVSCKFQRTSGTAEEKIAYEVIKLMHTMKFDPRYVHGWIAMGGDGWSPGMKEFVKSELESWIPEMKSKITIIQSTDELLTNGIQLRSKA